MKVLVTGISGFIGRNLANFLKINYDVIGITRKINGFDLIEGIEYKESDYSIASLTEIFKEVGAEAIVNLASQKAGREELEGVQGYENSIFVLENVILSAKDCDIKNIINISSRCVYGDYTENTFKESDETHPINKYGVMKIWGEILSEYYNRTAGMRIKNLRLSQVVGFPMNDKFMFSTFLEKVIKNETLDIYGQGNGKRDYIYIKDVCTAIECAIKHSEQCGIYNIGSGIAISNLEVAEKMVHFFNSSSKINIIEDSPKDKSRIVLDMTKTKNELDFTCKYKIDDILNDMVVQINRK